MTYKMTCTCGDVMTVEADSKEQADEKMKTLMNEEAVAKHFAEKHAGQPVPSIDQVHANISQDLQPVAAPTA